MHVHGVPLHTLDLLYLFSVLCLLQILHSIPVTTPESFFRGNNHGNSSSHSDLYPIACPLDPTFIILLVDASPCVEQLSGVFCHSIFFLLDSSLDKKPFHSAIRKPPAARMNHVDKVKGQRSKIQFVARCSAALARYRDNPAMHIGSCINKS